MAHFAEVDGDGYVVRVIVIDNSELIDADGNESEARGKAFCRSLLGGAGRWIQCSYNGRIRGIYPGPGYRYDQDLDEFVLP